MSLVNKSEFTSFIESIVKNPDMFTTKCSICSNRKLCFNSFPTTFEPFPCDGFEVNNSNPSFYEKMSKR
jgi:hypothetical protein